MPLDGEDQGLIPIREPLEARLVRSQYVPAAISIIAGALLWGGSRIYRSHFGLGTNEWRVLSALSNYPGLTAASVGKELGMNKAIVSRSVATLRERRLIVLLRERGARRLYLTGAGRAQHDAILPIALHREKLLLAGLSESEVATFRALLAKILVDLAALEAYDAEQAPGGSDGDADGER